MVVGGAASNRRSYVPGWQPQAYRPGGGYTPQFGGYPPQGGGYAPQGGEYLPQGGYDQAMQHGHASPAYKTGTSGPMGGSPVAQGMGGMGGGVAIPGLAEVMLHLLWVLRFRVWGLGIMAPKR